MRACALVSCVIVSVIQIICAREYARPSPTDMPYSQRDILNKKLNMKSYIKALKSFKVAPRLAGNETDDVGHLMVEGEKIRIPFSESGLSEVSKISLDQNKLRRYLRILNMELEATPPTIEVDSSKIIDYVKMLNIIDKHEARPTDLLSRSRIKLMRGGRMDNTMYKRGHQQETNIYDEDYLVDKYDSLAYSTINKNQFRDSDINRKKPEECLGSQNSDSADLDYSKPVRDVAANQYLEGDIYDLDSELGNRLLEGNVNQLDDEKKNLPEYIIANKFNGEENYNNDLEPFDLEYIDNSQIRMKPSGVTEAFAKEEDSYPRDPTGNKEVLDFPINSGVGNDNEKSGSNEWISEYEKNKDQSLFDSPFDIPVPFNHVISKEFGAIDEKRDDIKEVESQDTKLKQQMAQEEVRYENGKILEPSVGVGRSGAGGRIVKDTNPQLFGSFLNNLLNKLSNTEKPVYKLSQVTNIPANISNLNNSIFNQQNIHNDLDITKPIEIETASFIQKLSSTESSLICQWTSNGSSDHKIFPLKPEDEIVNVPKMGYFKQCFEPQKNSQAMPTKPPKMFSKYYLSKLKKFDKYNDDSDARNFFEEHRFPLFGTKESELSKILNVNLDHLHLDRGALYKIVGKALKIDEEKPQNYIPPKWLEDKYDELLHASHRGQNFNDYDYIEKSRHMFLNDRFNIRNRKKSVLEKNSKSM